MRSKADAPFTRDEYARRVAGVERALDEAGLDALIAYSAGHQPGPVAYVAGYEPRFGLHDVAFFVLVPGQAYTLLANAFWDDPASLTWTDDVRVTSAFGPALADLLPGEVRRLGIAGLGFFPAPVLLALPDVEVVDATPLLKRVAQIKSPAEQAVVRRCAAMSEAGGRAFLDGVGAGVDERALQLQVEHAIIGAGADGLAFPTLLFTGEVVPTGIGFAQRRALQSGEQANIVCGATVHGYRTEIGRVTCVGQAAPAAERIMNVAAEMHAAMLDVMRPGVPVRDAAGAAVSVANRHGLADYLYRSANAGPGYAGHGMGCWYSEYPDINTEVSDVLAPGMLVILEARLGVPGVGGATITDPVLVTARGAERLVDLDICTWRDD